jgi:hypothetical protein
MTGHKIPPGSWIDMEGLVPPGTTVCDILTRGKPIDGVFPDQPPTEDEILAFMEQCARPFPIEIYDDETEKSQPE